MVTDQGSATRTYYITEQIGTHVYLIPISSSPGMILLQIQEYFDISALLELENLSIGTPNQRFQSPAFRSTSDVINWQGDRMSSRQALNRLPNRASHELNLDPFDVHLSSSTTDIQSLQLRNRVPRSAQRRYSDIVTTQFALPYSRNMRMSNPDVIYSVSRHSGHMPSAEILHGETRGGNRRRLYTGTESETTACSVPPSTRRTLEHEPGALESVERSVTAVGASSGNLSSHRIPQNDFPHSRSSPRARPHEHISSADAPTRTRAVSMPPLRHRQDDIAGSSRNLSRSMLDAGGCAAHSSSNQSRHLGHMPNAEVSNVELTGGFIQPQCIPTRYKKRRRIYSYNKLESTTHSAPLFSRRTQEHDPGTSSRVVRSFSAVGASEASSPSQQTSHDEHMPRGIGAIGERCHVGPNRYPASTHASSENRPTAPPSSSRQHQEDSPGVNTDRSGESKNSRKSGK